MNGAYAFYIFHNFKSHMVQIILGIYMGNNIMFNAFKSHYVLIKPVPVLKIYQNQQTLNLA